jgi:hypothetical protein
MDEVVVVSQSPSPKLQYTIVPCDTFALMLRVKPDELKPKLGTTGKGQTRFLIVGKIRFFIVVLSVASNVPVFLSITSTPKLDPTT